MVSEHLIFPKAISKPIGHIDMSGLARRTSWIASITRFVFGVYSWVGGTTMDADWTKSPKAGDSKTKIGSKTKLVGISYK